MMNTGVAYALGAAALFGVSTPLAKLLVGAVPPLLLAGLLYAGSGLGLLTILGARRLAPGPRAPLERPRGSEWGWLTGAILLGGVAGPVALMFGLTATAASTASLLLNLEGVFTALLAGLVFGENYGRRVALGMVAIVAGGLVLAWAPGAPTPVSTGALLVAAACLCWAIDNNLTRKVAASDALLIAGLKGLAAGAVNIGLALAMGDALPRGDIVAAAFAVGLAGYGASLVLFVLALRHLGSARTGAYFSVAPFFGAVVALGLQGDPVTMQLALAGGLMALGVWLHLGERHDHAHAHPALEHSHPHVHDEHHRHAHAGWDGKEPHSHRHTHAPLVHAHPHFPDLHHDHTH